MQMLISSCVRYQFRDIASFNPRLCGLSLFALASNSGRRSWFHLPFPHQSNLSTPRVGHLTYIYTIAWKIHGFFDFPWPNRGSMISFPAFQIKSPPLLSTLSTHSISTKWFASPSVRITPFALFHHLSPPARLRFTSTQIRICAVARIPEITGVEVLLVPIKGSDTDTAVDGRAPSGTLSAKCTCCLPIGRKPPVLRIKFQLASFVPWTT